VVKQMPRLLTEIDKIRRQVLTEVSRLTFEGRLLREIEELPYKLYDEGIRNYRCCQYKERAVLKERIRLAVGQDPKRDREPLVNAAIKALKEDKVEGSMLRVIDIACDRCPIDAILVTDACRNCVAHNCVNACPKKAIQIINGKAVIDKEKCVECGLCAKACSFGAILQLQRPCERSCEVKAISSSEDRHAVIDEEKCVSCGACTVGCPFGAISYKSEIVPVIKRLKEKDDVIALVAPSISGQFGRSVSLGQVITGLKELGFSEIREVAVAADEVAKLEAEEEIDGWLTNSCCPAYKNYVTKHFPELKDHVSHQLSPMALMATQIRKEKPNSYLVFIGPCLSKKEEAQELVDAVLTFEEIACMFVARDINLATLGKSPYTDSPSKYGLGFAQSGGVSAALGTYKSVKVKTLNGLSECKKALLLAKANRIDAEFLEGMACSGGCVGGPGTLVDANFSRRVLQSEISEREKEE
jgi:ferredoxin hydrogenase large subunit